MRLVYTVHDLGDAAVARRLAMLRPWLGSAVVIGCYRGARPPLHIESWPAIALGRTRDGRLGRRMLSVLRARAALLPNRLYEVGLHGAVPIALATVETGRWLAQHDAGVVLGERVEEDLLRYFAALQPADYAVAARRLAAVPRAAWIDEGDDGARLAHALGSRSGQSSRQRPRLLSALADGSPQRS